MFGNSFCFLFSKTFFWKYKEKTIFLYFWIKNVGEDLFQARFGVEGPARLCYLQETWTVFKTCSHIEERCASSKKVKKKKKIETVMNSIEFPLLYRTAPQKNSVISTTSNDLSNWSRLSSLWPFLYGTSCCFIEFASLIGLRFDFDHYGLVPRSSPRQVDLILNAGTITMKMAPSLVRLYEQMLEPKYVITMGACTITGGMFSIFP